jgi:hypothetical protein
MIRIAALVSIVLLAACSNGSQWSKDGVPPSKAALDIADCNSLAGSASRTDNNINQDILSARGRDWQNTGALSYVQTSQPQNEDRSKDLIFRCMVGKGYAPG